MRLKFCQKYVVSGKVELIFYQNPFVSDSGDVWLTLCQNVFAVVVVYDYYEWPVWLVFYQSYFVTTDARMSFVQNNFFVSGDFSAAFCQNVFVGDCA